MGGSREQKVLGLGRNLPELVNFSASPLEKDYLWVRGDEHQIIECQGQKEPQRPSGVLVSLVNSSLMARQSELAHSEIHDTHYLIMQPNCLRSALCSESSMSSSYVFLCI